MPHPIEVAILDESLTDAEVYEVIMSSRDDAPERGDLPTEVWEQKMAEFGALIEHLGNLTFTHRPNVHKRLLEETLADHASCCDPTKEE